ncbi:MAG: hypothetical protein H0X31_23460, partial [Nostocaceae cyanobacterium]|nr:hypothetical protein [Nostocaceae cyanobacterium]
MIYSVVINVGYGNLYEGFPVVTVGLWALNNPRPQKSVGNLPPAPNLVDLYRNWRLIYQNLCHRQAFVSMRNLTENARSWELSPENDSQIEIDDNQITNVSVVDFNELSQHLQQCINIWLESPGILSISRQIRAALNPTDEIRVIIETQDIIIQKLPWHCCSFFQDYQRSEISFSRTEYQQVSCLQLPQITRSQVRILAILGNCQGIDLEQEKRFLQTLPDAEVELVV